MICWRVRIEIGDEEYERMNEEMKGCLPESGCRSGGEACEGMKGDMLESWD